MHADVQYEGVGAIGCNYFFPGRSQRAGGVKEQVGGVKEQVGGVKEQVGRVKERVGGVKERENKGRRDVWS